MPSAREDILARLRGSLAQGRPFEAAQQPAPIQPVARIEPNPDGPEELLPRFCAELERVRGVPHRAATHAEAAQHLITLLSERSATRALVWEGLPDEYGAALRSANVGFLQGDKQLRASAHVGITGVSCAVAATGTLILQHGPGRLRSASLLPPVHVAIVEVAQLVPRLEDYLAMQRAQNLAALRQSSNVVFITGASRTADIEMNVVYGVHGPLELHVLIVGS